MLNCHLLTQNLYNYQPLSLPLSRLKPPTPVGLKTIGLSFAYRFLVTFSLPTGYSPVLQSARPRAVALASYTGVDKIIKSTVGFTREDIWID